MVGGLVALHWNTSATEKSFKQFEKTSAGKIGRHRRGVFKKYGKCLMVKACSRPFDVRFIRLLTQPKSPHILLWRELRETDFVYKAEFLFVNGNVFRRTKKLPACHKLPSPHSRLTRRPPRRKRLFGSEKRFGELKWCFGRAIQLQRSDETWLLEWSGELGGMQRWRRSVAPEMGRSQSCGQLLVPVDPQVWRLALKLTGDGPSPQAECRPGRRGMKAANVWSRGFGLGKKRAHQFF